MTYVPTNDGPAHVFEAFVLANYGDSGFERLTEEYVLSAAPSPNLLTQLCLALLLLVVPATAAEKLVAVTIVSLFALGMTYAVRSVSRERTWLAALAAPLGTGYLHFFGFFNFAVGTGLSLLSLGVFLRRRGSWGPWSALLLAALLLLTVSAHLLPFAMAAGAIGLVLLRDVVLRLTAQDARPPAAGGASPASRSRDILVPLLALVVPTALSLLFLLQSEEVRSEGTGPDFWERAMTTFSPRRLARFTVGQVAVFSRVELAFGLLWCLAIGLIVGCALLRGRRALLRQPVSALTAIAVLSTAALVVIPDIIGTLYHIQVRFFFYAVLFALLAAAAVPAVERLRPVAVGMAVLVTVGLAVVRIPAELRYNELLREFDTVAAVMRPQSTFITWRAWPATSPVAAALSPTAHASDRVALATRSVNLNHLDARYAYFPAHFRELDELGVRSQDMLVPKTWLSFLDQAREQGQEPDYIILWGRQKAPIEITSDPRYGEALSLLSSQYSRRFVSGPEGLLELFERCTAERPCPTSVG
jgi:hypothetical protein